MTHFINVLENNAVKNPNDPAIRTGSDTLNYDELNKRINQFANLLQQQTWSTDKAPRIAIVYHRSLDMFLWMFAAWKINASFMLIDSGDLQQAGVVKSKLDRIQPQFVITAKQLQNNSELTGFSLILTDDVETKNKINAQSNQFTFQPLKDNTEAYIIATSGTSTGVPKLVVVNHTLAANTGLAAVFDDSARLLKITKKDCVLIDGAVNWDPNIYLLGVGLYHGASIYIASPEEVHDRHQLLTRCAKEKINVILAVPSAVHLYKPEIDVLDKIENLRLFFTGETLDKATVDYFLRVARGGIYNGYGPSEGPIGITATQVVDSDHISIGRAMTGREYKLIKKDGTEVKDGEEGEIVWKAEGFGGYLGNKEETEKKIIIINGETYYRTADLAVQIDDDLNYLGRVDKQFKIGGILFNPELVQPFLAQHGIESRTIGVKPPNSPHTIPVVFYKSETVVDEENLRQLLVKQQSTPILKFMRLGNDEHFPNTKNSKTDGAALAQKYSDYLERNTPKATTVKEVLQQIWCAHTGLDVIDPSKTFQEHTMSSYLFFSFLSALAIHPMLKNVNVNEIRSHHKTLKFDVLVDLVMHDRASYVTYLYQEKIDYPVIIIDGDVAENYEAIAPNSPIIIIRPSNEKESEENKFNDALKTIKRLRIEGPYYVVQVFKGNEYPVYGWGVWEKIIPNCFYFLEKFWDVNRVREKLVLDMDVRIMKRLSRDELILDDKSSLEQQLTQAGILPKHLSRLARSNMSVKVTVTSMQTNTEQIRKNLESFGFKNVSFEGQEQEAVRESQRAIVRTLFRIPQPQKRIYSQRKFDPIVKFYHSEQKGNPLFLFAPFTGEDVYDEFCESLNRPCIVAFHPLHSKNKHSFPTEFHSLKDLAQFYAEVVAHLQPYGSISLAGWSFGGLVAMAVAKILERRISYVGMFDTTAPEHLSPTVLMERIQWILKTYAIPHDENDIKKMLAYDDEQVWTLLFNLSENITDIKKLKYVKNIIQVCRQHYYFGFESVQMIAREKCNLYRAGGGIRSSNMIFKYSKPTKVDSLGWDVPCTLIFGTDHFTILDSEGLKSAFMRDCTPYRSSNVNVQETLKALVVSQIPKNCAHIENPELQQLIDKQESKVVLQEENKSGLQLLQGFWRAYISEPTKNAMPIYINLKEFSDNSFEAFFEKLELSPTQPHCIDEMNIIFIVEHVEEIDPQDLLKFIGNSPIDLSRHPVVWLCDKDHYQQHPNLEKILKLEPEYENTRKLK